MKIGFLTFEQFYGRKDIGSSRIRAQWLVNHWPEAELFKMGEKYDVIIYQKVYWPENVNGVELECHNKDTNTYSDGRLYDLVYIDADHTYKGCIADLLVAEKHLKDEGWIVLDDFLHAGNLVPNSAGVIQAVREFLLKRLDWAYSLRNLVGE